MSTESEQALKIKYKPLIPEKGNYMSMKTNDELRLKFPVLDEVANATIDAIKSDAYQAGVESKYVPSETVDKFIQSWLMPAYPDTLLNVEDYKRLKEKLTIAFNAQFQSGKKEGWKDGMENSRAIINSISVASVISKMDIARCGQAILTAIENKEK